MSDETEYTRWLEQCRGLSPPENLADRIMSALDQPANSPWCTSRPTGKMNRFLTALLCTGAALVFAIRVVALIGNLVVPASSYPEFASDEIGKETVHEHVPESRS